MQEATISEAARQTGVSRMQIHRGLNSGRIRRSPNGGVYLEDVATLRPGILLRGRPKSKPDPRSHSAESAKPYIDRERGAQRLRAMLKVCAYEWGMQGRADDFSEIVAGAQKYAAEAAFERSGRRKR